MKNLIFAIVIIGFTSSSCVAQRPIKTMQGSNNYRIAYIRSNTFNNLQMNGIKLENIKKANTIEDITNLLGQPMDIKEEIDKAIDGTVLFTRKLLIYPGLRLVFSQKNNKYRLSRVDFISEKSSLKIDGKKIKLGMNLAELPDDVKKIGYQNNSGRIAIQVAKSNSSIKTSANRSEQIHFSEKSIKIDYDPNTQKVTKLSILMYTI